MRQLVVLLPTYNEEISIDRVVSKIAEECRSWRLRIVACDDGSRDATAQRLEELKRRYPITVLTHSINRGLGETMRDLLEHAAQQIEDDGIIVRMDCDDSHEPKFVKSMIDKIDEGYDVVIASRFQKGGGQLGVSSYRKFISLCANLYMKLFFPMRGVRDYTCGFRAYRGKAVKDAINAYGNNFIQLKGLGFTCTLEKLVKMKLLGKRFAEVPFVLRYDQKRSVSKMVSNITVLGYLVMAVMYHWPWGGWRSAPGLTARAADQISPDKR